MSILRLVFLTGLVPLCGTAGAAFADSPGPGQQPANLTREMLKPYLSMPLAKADAAANQADTVVEMATYRVSESKYPRYADLSKASTQAGILEPCALVKTNVAGKRRYDFFLAPVALSNGAAGFGLAKLSW
jgi:hypothetical protein